MNKKDYNHVGGGSFEVYEEKEKEEKTNASEVAGGIIAVVFLLLMVGCLAG